MTGATQETILSFIYIMEEKILSCPNCGVGIIIESVNCGIFRCGAFKNGLQQIDPHAEKETVERLIANDEIWGCGQPFQLLTFPLDDVKTRLVKCGWI
jgi:hypothetical protein